MGSRTVDIPTLSNIVIGSEVYGVPPGAQQKGATSLLDSGNDRMQQVQYVNGDLWGELTTAVTIPGDTASAPGPPGSRCNHSLGKLEIASPARRSTTRAMSW